MPGYHGFLRRGRFSTAPAVSLSLTALFLAFLAMTAPHQVHHLTERIQALVTHQSVSSSNSHNKSDDHDHPAPVPAQTICHFLFAGQASPGCLSQLPSIGSLQEARTFFFPGHFSAEDSVHPNPFPIRAPPLAA